jgi:hypothetical protein
MKTILAGMLRGSEGTREDGIARLLGVSRLVGEQDLEHPKGGHEQPEDGGSHDGEASFAISSHRCRAEDERGDGGEVCREEWHGQPEVVEELITASLAGGDGEGEDRQENSEDRDCQDRPSPGSTRRTQHMVSLSDTGAVEVGANVTRELLPQAPNECSSVPRVGAG